LAKKIVLFIVAYIIWIGLIGLVGMNYLNTALADKVSPFNETTGPLVFLIGALIVFAGPIVAFMIWFYHTPKWEKDLQVSGTPASALVLEVKDTGVRTGGSRSRGTGTPWLAVKLQVQPGSEAPFQVMLEKSATHLFNVRQGAMVNVKYDPNNKKHVVVVQPDNQFANAAGVTYTPNELSDFFNMKSKNMTQDLLELVTLHKRGELTDAEFEAAKKKLLG